jgi:tetratricopeptide (TPR) repeat protein
MRIPSFIVPLFVVVAGLASFWPIVAVAQLKQEQNMCAGQDGATAEIQILSCTAVLESGKFSSRRQAITFKTRGTAYFRKHDYDRALQDYDQAIRIYPKYGEAFDARCWARATANKLPEALKDCQEALRLRPNFAPTMSTLGLVYFRLGRFDDAIKTYSAALQIEPKSASSLYGRGMAELKKGDTASGEADIAASKAIKDVTAEMTDYGVK